jgi:hypothetical protein
MNHALLLTLCPHLTAVSPHVSVRFNGKDVSVRKNITPLHVHTVWNILVAISTTPVFVIGLWSLHCIYSLVQVNPSTSYFPPDLRLILYPSRNSLL